MGTAEQRRYLASKDFSLFFTYYFLDYVKYPYAPFHFEMFDDVKKIMDGTYREVAWIMFRESAKTSITKGFLMWLLVYNKRRYINVDSFDKENAERVLFDTVWGLQRNPKIINDFGQLFNADRNPDEITQKRVSNFVTNTGIRVEAHSTQESVRGRLHGHQRPDALIVDDFETNKTKDSQAYTEQVISHINEFKGGLDATAFVLYLGNYITEYGSVASLLERAKEDPRLKIRMVPVIEDGKPTWPSKYVLTDADAKKANIGKSDDEVKYISLEDKKRSLGSQVFNAEMMNMPIDEQTQEFFKVNFQYRTFDEVIKEHHRKFATIDSALTKKSDSDFTGITKNYVNELNQWNIDARQYKINSKELIGQIFQLHDEGFEKIGIEEGAFTEAVEPFFEEECAKRNKYPYIVKLKHGGIMKETRIRGLIPRYEQHSIFHITGRTEKLEDQMLRFPKSRHDDVLDSLAYQLKIAEPPYPQRNELPYEEEKPLYADIGI